MPFDMSPQADPPRLTVYQRLCILRELLAQADNDQDHWNKCLWSQARKDKRLLADGLSGFVEPTLIDVGMFGPSAPALFSDIAKSVKAFVVECAIDRELLLG